MEEHSAELLEFVLSGRPDRVAELLLAAMPEGSRQGLKKAQETIAALGLAEKPVAPSAGLRARVLGTIARHRADPVPRKAVLVCDMLNDHLTPGRPLYVPRALEIVPALQARLEKARATAEPVVYVLDRHAPDDPELDVWGTHNVEGTPGADVWPALAPLEGDYQVTKPSFSAFYNTDLDRLLTSLQVDTVVVTGCATEVQLLATATDALQRGYAVEMPRECQAGTNPVAEDVSMGVLSALVPYQPARQQRLAAIASAGGPPRSAPPSR